MPTLSDDEILQALAGLPAWKRDANAIIRRLEFPDFAAAMKFVNRVADAAEQANHHPDITINYNKVTMLLTSHDSGGITKRDIRMAGRIDEIASAQG